MTFCRASPNEPPVRAIKSAAFIRLLVADANAMVCELLTQAFHRRRMFEVSGCATTTAQVLSVISSAAIDVALVGAHLQDGRGSGLEAIRQMRMHSPHTRGIVLLDRSEGNLVVESFRAGAKGVFCRSQDSFEALSTCTAHVHAGEIWATSAQLDAVMEAFSSSAPKTIRDWKGHTILTPQEDRIVQLVATGLTNREVAAELRVSDHTVKNHLFRVFEKLGISSRVELVLLATRRQQQVLNIQDLAS